MVQQTNDSKFSGYGLPNTETGLANQDKQLPLPLAVPAKKTALRDLQNENRITVPKSTGSSLFPKESGPTIKAVKASGTKRPAPECLVSAPHHQSLTSNAANGHLVYVRRKPEVELAKNSIFDNTSNNAYCPQARKLGDQDETPQQKSQMMEPKICIPEVAPIPRTSLMCYSSGKPSVPPSLGKSSNILQPADSSAIPPLDYPKKMNNQHWDERYCQSQDLLKILDQANQEDYPKKMNNQHWEERYCQSQDLLKILDQSNQEGYPKKMNNQHWEERYCQSQDLLKILDQSNQEEYVQMLRSLSSVELSRHAVELEKRSIQLSLKEAKEMQRVRLLDVLGKYSKISRAPSAQQGQSEN